MKIRRPFRPRFRLRTFLVVVTIFCVWLGWHIHGARRQREAVAVISAHGGFFAYDYEGDGTPQSSPGKSWVPGPVLQLLGRDFFHSVVRVRFSDTAIAENRKDLQSFPAAAIARLPRVTDLYLAHYEIDDDDLRHVGRLTRLKRLGIENAAALTDDGTPHLSQLRQLEILYIRNGVMFNRAPTCQLGDRSLEAISRLPELRELSVWGTFTDAGVNHLGRLKNLRALNLSHWDTDYKNEVTDQSLKFLLDLPSLDRLELEQTKATPEFRSKLMDKFPKCVVDGTAREV